MRTRPERDAIQATKTERRHLGLSGPLGIDRAIFLFLLVFSSSCSSGDVYEAATIALGDIRCAENIRINSKTNAVSVSVTGVKIGSSSDGGTGAFSVGVPLPPGQNTVSQRCQDLVDTAKRLAKLEYTRREHEIELLRIETELEAVRLERETDELDQLRNSLHSEW